MVSCCLFKLLSEGDPLLSFDVVSELVSVACVGLDVLWGRVSESLFVEFSLFSDSSEESGCDVCVPSWFWYLFVFFNHCFDCGLDAVHVVQVVWYFLFECSDRSLYFRGWYLFLFRIVLWRVSSVSVQFVLGVGDGRLRVLGGDLRWGGGVFLM